MQELTAPTRWASETSGSVAARLWTEAAAQPQRPALAHRESDGFRQVDLEHVAMRVRSLVKGLIGAGIERGDRVAIFSPTRIEFTYLDLALWTIGAVAVTIYETSSAEQVEWIVADSAARAIFVDGEDRRRVFEARAGRLGTCEAVFDLDDLEALERLGERVSDAEVERRRAAVETSDLATLVYTSGTTGRPKGVELTHGNLTWTLGNTIVEMGDLFHPGARTLMFLPLAHIFARLVQLAAIETGTLLYYSSGLDKLVEELEMVRPTFIFAAPRVFEKVYNRARLAAHESGKGRIFELAADVAIRQSRQRDIGRLSPATRVLHGLFDALVYTRIRAVLGGDVTYAISGSAPLGERLGHFFRGIGIEVLEGYGLTETAAGGAVNLPGATRIGSVGRPTPGSTIRIADDGEILISGGHVMQGYWNNPQATSEVLDHDGWLHTGDIGRLDEDGFLYITGRKKEIIVTAGGKNVAPASLEDRVRAHRLIGGCVVVGDRRPFVAALVTIDPDEWQVWAAEHDVEGTVAENVDHPALRDEVAEAVRAANRAVSRAESIRAFRILPEDFTVDGGEVTTSLKVRRGYVESKHADLVESMYAEVLA